MTSMIDVVFLLLIFFICTASFEQAEDLLPTALRGPGNIDAAEIVPPELRDLEQVVVKLAGPQGKVSWTVNDQACNSLAEVKATLTAVAQVDLGLTVILDPTPEVPLGDLVQVYDICRSLGFSRISFATNQPQG